MNHIHNDVVLQAVVLAGGAASGKQLQLLVKQAQREQRRLCLGISEEKTGRPKRPKVQVDSVFLKRLLRILRM